MKNQEQELVRDIRKGLLQWYDFPENAFILFVGDARDALVDMLREKSREMICVSVEQTCNSEWQQKYSAYFDYIISVEVLEKQIQPEQILRIWKNLLKSKGRLLLGMNNRFGIRYFCGDRDIHTQQNFDGIESYKRAYGKKEDGFCGRSYSRSEILEMLQCSGWPNCRFYSVFSDLKNPTHIYAEDYLPKEDLECRVFPCYHYPKTVFLEEERLYEGLIQNNMFHQMANAYLIESSLDGIFSDVEQVTSSMERGRLNALFTVIRKSGVVEKRAAYPEGRSQLTRLIENAQALRKRGIATVDAKMEQDTYIMPYYHAEVGQVYFKRLLQQDPQKFLSELDHFRDLILKSSELVESDYGNGWGAVLRRGYLDMIPLNSFHVDHDFVFYDQEFCEENYPVNAIMERVISTLYGENAELEKIIPQRDLFHRYGLMQCLDQWQQMDWEFLSKLRKEKELRLYHEVHRRDSGIVSMNRFRINYSMEDYQRLCVDIFENLDSHKIILFGAGRYANRFLTLYGRDYLVYGIVDNQAEKWGQQLQGIEIQSPEILRQLEQDTYKVLICIKDCMSVLRQLDAMGITQYSIYNPSMVYPKKYHPIVPLHTMQEVNRELKKYHIGYIAGVFDLFHIGHLNLFKRAKEQCEYLIVGVVTDEGSKRLKKSIPFIPFEERIELVRSCRYVDEAVEIPLQYGGTRDAFRMYHFDCQFSGSDYVDNPDWMAEKKFLEEHDSTMIFFPYTEHTSSSKIKELIQQKLL